MNVIQVILNALRFNLSRLKLNWLSLRNWSKAQSKLQIMKMYKMAVTRYFKRNFHLFIVACIMYLYVYCIRSRLLYAFIAFALIFMVKWWTGFFSLIGLLRKSVFPIAHHRCRLVRRKFFTFLISSCASVHHFIFFQISFGAQTSNEKKKKTPWKCAFAIVAKYVTN